MKKNFLSFLALLLIGFTTSVVCSACSIFGSNQGDIITVTFYANDDVYKKIYVSAGDMIALPEYESLTHTLNGWKLRGEGELMTGTFFVNESTYFIADLNDTGYRVLTYEVDGEVHQTERVKIGEEFPLIKIDNTTSYVFNGWKVSGKGDLLLASSLYKIDANTTLVADLTDTGKRLITYQVNGVLYKTEEVEKGKSFALVDYEFTVEPYTNRVSYAFNGWQVDGKGSLLKESYTVSKNTTFVAKIVDTGYREVIYKVADEVYDTQKVKKGASFVLKNYESENPGYVFRGWQVGGQGSVLNGNHTTSKNITLLAKLEDTGKRVVTYEINGQVYCTDIVNKGEKFNLAKYNYDLPPYNSTISHVFNGWKIKGQSKILPDPYSVINDITLVADFTDTGKRALNYHINGQLVTQELNKGAQITLLTVENNNYGYNEAKQTFVGWKINGQGELIKPATSLTINENLILVAVIEDHYWVPKTWTGALTDFKGKYVWMYGNICYYSCGEQQYQLVNNQWVVKKWEGDLTQFDGDNVWYNGANYYCSQTVNDEYSHFKLEEGKWRKINLTIDFAARNAWSFNGKYFYNLSEFTESSKYEFFVDAGFTSTDPAMLEDFDGGLVWSDGENCYYSENRKTFKLEGYHWKEISSYNNIYDTQYCYGSLVWTDGINTYFQQINSLEIKVWKNGKWVIFDEWYGVVPYNISNFIWTDGTNYYYSDETEHYVLNKSAIQQKIQNIE